jgi:hypothetical protein
MGTFFVLNNLKEDINLGVLTRFTLYLFCRKSKKSLPDH